MLQETGQVSVPPLENHPTLSILKRAVFENDCLYNVILGFDIDTVKMLMNIFVSHRCHQTKDDFHLIHV